MALFAQHSLPVPHSELSVGNPSPQLHVIAGLATKSRGKVGRHYFALLTRGCKTAVHREARWITVQKPVSCPCTGRVRTRRVLDNNPVALVSVGQKMLG